MSEWSGTLYGLGLCGRSLPETAKGVSGTVEGHGLRVCAERSEYQASPADSLIFDRHGDDRFADNILRACRNLPQHGDDEEERDAAEEGALIEASGYPDPANDRYFA